MNIKRNGREKRAGLLAAGVAGVMMPGVAALGLGIANRVELKELQDQVTRLEEKQDGLLIRITESENLVKTNFDTINQALQEFEGDRYLQNQYRKARDMIKEVNKKIEDWTTVYFNLMYGQLDPSLVSISDFYEGFQTTNSLTQKMNFKVVPFNGHLSVYFSVPVTGWQNETGLFNCDHSCNSKKCSSF